MVEFLSTMVEWFQRSNGKNHITNEVNGRETTRKAKKIMEQHENDKSKRRTRPYCNIPVGYYLKQ